VVAGGYGGIVADLEEALAEFGMDAALGITDEDDTQVSGMGGQHGLERELGGFGQRLAFVQNKKTGGGVLLVAPVHGEKGKHLLPDGFKAPLICRIHRHTHEGFAVSPYVLHKPRRTCCFARTGGSKEEQMAQCMGLGEKQGEAGLNPFAPERWLDRGHGEGERDEERRR